MKRISLFVALAIAPFAIAQEVVTVARPAVSVSREIAGEFIAYTDAGCIARAVSRIQVDPEPVSAAQCTLSRNRTRGQVADAIDAGALERE